MINIKINNIEDIENFDGNKNFNKNTVDSITKENEIFKTIPEYSKYLISSFGRILNKKYNFLKLSPNKLNGYVTVVLKNDFSINKIFKIHRLVAMIFIPNPKNKPLVDHLNRIRHDNHIINLSWVTYSENSTNSKKRTNKGNKRQIYQIDLKTGEILKEWDSITTVILSFGENLYHPVSNVCKGITSEYKGYNWKYKDSYTLPNEKWISFELKKDLIIKTSNFGRIQTSNGKMTFGSLHCGYYIISIKKIIYSVHRIICEAFNKIDNCNTYNENGFPNFVTNHIDGCKINNKAENLEFVTQKDNMIHASETGLIIGNKICQFDLEGNYIKTYINANVAAKFCNIKIEIMVSIFKKSHIFNNFQWFYEKDLIDKNPLDNNGNFKVDKSDITYNKYLDIVKINSVKTKNIKICKFKLDGTFQMTYSNTIEAAKILGITDELMRKICIITHLFDGFLYYDYTDCIDLKIPISTKIDKVIPKSFASGIAIYQFSLDNILINKYPTFISASKATGMGHKKLSRMCNRFISTDKFKWFRENDEVLKKLL